MWTLAGGVRILQRHRIILTLWAIPTVAAIWFACVDWSWFIESCPDCMYQCSVYQYRVCGYAISESDDPTPTAMQRVTADLGQPCTHGSLTRWHKHRWWGLLICGKPCINGILNVSDDLSWYDDSVTERLRRIAEDDPALAGTFYDRVILNHDWDYWHKFIDEIDLRHASHEPVASP